MEKRIGTEADPGLRAEMAAGGAAVCGAISGVVSLNVGGCTFTTTAETLRGGAGGADGASSYFQSLLSGRFGVTRDQDGKIFVDRDGKRFRFILNFLRDGSLHVAQADPQSARLVFQELLEEAEFFGIESLRVELQERINAIPPPELAMDRENMFMNEVLGKVEAALVRFQTHSHQRTPTSSNKYMQRGRALRPAATPEAQEAQEALHDFNLNVSF